MGPSSSRAALVTARPDQKARTMEPIAVIFPSLGGDPLSVDPRFAAEYEACSANSSYEVALCNIEDCIAGDALVVDKVSSRKATYSLLRTAPTWRTTYERIEQALKHKGYKLIVNWNGHHRYSWTDLKFLTSAYAEEIPDAHRSHIPPDTQKADWRAYYFDGVFFFGTRLRRRRKDDEPSIELLSCAEGSFFTKPFTYVDFYKDERGFWLPLKCGDAQFSELPRSASASDFYNRLAKVIASTPHLPEWTWCLVGDVIDENKAGMEGRLVRGTRNFVPGTKVYLIDELGGNGWERPVVLGIPRYCDHLVSLIMPVRKICNLRCEKVYDRQVIAVVENAYYGDFFSPIRSRYSGTWDRSYRSLNDIAILLEWMPEYYGISRGKDPEDYFDDEGWANRKFKHICEVCGKEEMLTPNEAKAAGWNYPSKLGDFGVISPRICGSCPVEETFWWAEKQPGMHPWSQEIPYEKRQVYKRILEEPDVLLREINS